MRLCGQHRVLRVQGHDDPEHDVGEQTGASEQNAEQPDGAHEGGIDVEVAGDAGTDAGDFFVCAEAGEGALLDASCGSGATRVPQNWQKTGCSPMSLPQFEQYMASPALPGRISAPQGLEHDTSEGCAKFKSPTGIEDFYRFRERPVTNRRSIPIITELMTSPAAIALGDNPRSPFMARQTLHFREPCRKASWQGRQGTKTHGIPTSANGGRCGAPPRERPVIIFIRTEHACFQVVNV